MNCPRSDLSAVRIRKDISELAKSKFCCQHAHTRIDFPDGIENMRQLVVTISIIENFGPYANGTFNFYLDIPKTYPFHPPVVTSFPRLWHPNIDMISGRVMIPILGNDWRPILTINTVLLALQLIFIEPGIHTIMNPRASEQLKQDPEQFKQQVQQMLSGGNGFYNMHFEAPKKEHSSCIVRCLPSNRKKRSLDVQEGENSWSSIVECCVESHSEMDTQRLVSDTMWKRARRS